MSPIRVTDVRCGRRPGPAVSRRRCWTPAGPVLQAGRIQMLDAGPAVRRFTETDYCYGTGTLTMRVDRIDWARPVPLDGDVWVEVMGVVIDRAGRAGARRQVLVRAATIGPPPVRKRPRLRP